MILICDDCGAKTEHEILIRECPICKKGRLFTEAEYKEKEEIQEALRGEEITENPFEQKNDTQELQNIIKEEIQDDIEILGNDATWYMIEDMAIAEDRAMHRRIFFACGGVMPLERQEKEKDNSI